MSQEVETKKVKMYKIKVGEDFKSRIPKTIPVSFTSAGKTLNSSFYNAQAAAVSAGAPIFGSTSVSKVGDLYFTTLTVQKRID